MESDPSIEQLLNAINLKQATIDSTRSRLHDPSIPSSKLLLLAAAARSGELVRAFNFCSRERLLGVTLAIGRMQLDSVLRIHATSIVDDADDFAEFMLAGNEPRKYKLSERSPRLYASNNQPSKSLTDSFLYTSLSEKWEPDLKQLCSEEPWLLHGHSDPDGLLSNFFGAVYKDGNMAVHLSNFHVMELFTHESCQGGSVPVFSTVSFPGDEARIEAVCVEMLFLVDQLSQLLGKEFPGRSV